MMQKLLVMYLFLHKMYCQEGGAYLQHVINDLKNIRGTENTENTDNRRAGAPFLTKQELASLFDSDKTQTVKVGNTTIAVHELDSDSDSNHKGFHYYYYPKESFKPSVKTPPVAVSKPGVQHHTHQHHVHVMPIQMDKDKKNHPMEPLFMAISGFMGMAVMYVLSMLVLPRIGIKPPKPKRKLRDEADGVARFALKAVKECTNCNHTNSRFVKFVQVKHPTH